MQTAPLLPSTSPGEWIRIYAMRLARLRPEMNPEQAVRDAIARYRLTGHLPPEQALNCIERVQKENQRALQT
jgi:hypothetical protein